MMKKRLLSLTAVLCFGMMLSLPPTVQAAPAAKPAAAKPAARPAVRVAAAGVKFIEITIKTLKTWPVKASGRCWDPPCFFQKFNKKLPARGAKDYSSYAGNKYFKKLCKRPIAPDPLVEIKIGKYEKFTTDKINNQCSPTFNIKHTFRVVPGDGFVVSVYDNDGAAKVQVKRDHMGTWSFDTIPPQLLKGGTLTLRGTGQSNNQIEELVLSARVIKRKVSPGCAGVYKVRIAEFGVKPKKESGKTWDRGFGKATRPDVIAALKIGSTTLTTPKQSNTFSAKFYNVGRVFTIKKGVSASLRLTDADIFGRKEMIGETAVTDVCSLINNQGMYTFTSFGRVKKVVLIFTKQR